MGLKEIREKVRKGEYRLSVHADKKRRRLGITLEEIEEAILTGEIVERYPKNRPNKYVLLGQTRYGDPIHVVCVIAPISQVVTIYYPEEDKWIKGKIRRR